MATLSSAPPNPADRKPQNPATGLGQSTNEIQQDAREEATKQSPASVFVNSEPMREEQVQNAVNFLSHPKVRGSPVIYRRSFLEKKGLTKEEIDEAFQRVPDPPPSTQAPSTSQEGQVRSASNVQTPVSTQTLQPAVGVPTGVSSSVGTLMQSRFHWYHGVLAVGLLALSGAGTAILIKNSIVPRLKSWIRKVVLEEEGLVKKTNAKPTLAEEAAAAAKAAAAAASDVAKVSQEMLKSKNEDKRYFEEFMNLLDKQVYEMKSMSIAMRKLEGETNSLGRSSLVGQDHRVPITNTKDINYQPPNPNLQISNPRLAMTTKPWGVGEAQNGSIQVLHSQASAEGLDSMVQNNGGTYQLEGETSEPWWQRSYARTTEIENADEIKAAPRGGRTNEQPVQRTWVPPPPPPVAIPEAAEAIRRPKPVQSTQLADDQSVSQPTNAGDEFQRITKTSESGNAVEINGGESGLNSNEVQEEQEHSHQDN